MTDLTTQTPKQIDAQLADLYYEQMKLDQKMTWTADTLHRLAGDKKERWIGDWVMSVEEAIWVLDELIKNPEAMAWSKHEAQEALDKWAAQVEQRDSLNAQVRVLDAEFRRRGGWTRAFVVTGGHVHSSMECSTCYPTTQFGWLPDLSGDNEDEIVAQAGERACTVCYPSAPVDVLSRPTSLWTEEEKKDQAAKEARRAEREAKKAKARANAPTASGEFLEVREHGAGYLRELKTERAAMMFLVNEVSDYINGDQPVWRRETTPEDMLAWETTLESVIESLAGKRQVDPQVIRDEVKAKAVKKQQKERGGPARRTWG